MRSVAGMTMKATRLKRNLTRRIKATLRSSPKTLSSKKESSIDSSENRVLNQYLRIDWTRRGLH